MIGKYDGLGACLYSHGFRKTIEASHFDAKAKKVLEFFEEKEFDAETLGALLKTNRGNVEKFIDKLSDESEFGKIKREQISVGINKGYNKNRILTELFNDLFAAGSDSPGALPMQKQTNENAAPTHKPECERATQDSPKPAIFKITKVRINKRDATAALCLMAINRGKLPQNDDVDKAPGHKPAPI